MLGKNASTFPTPFTTPLLIKSCNKPSGITVAKYWFNFSKSHKMPSCGYLPNLKVQKNISQIKNKNMRAPDSFLEKIEECCKRVLFFLRNNYFFLKNGAKIHDFFLHNFRFFLLVFISKFTFLKLFCLFFIFFNILIYRKIIFLKR